jgi:hypothetical protein
VIIGALVVVLFNYALPHSQTRIVEVIALATLLVAAVAIRNKHESFRLSLSQQNKNWAKRLFIVGLVMIAAAVVWLIGAIVLWAPAALVFLAVRSALLRWISIDVVAMDSLVATATWNESR